MNTTTKQKFDVDLLKGLILKALHTPAVIFCEPVIWAVMDIELLWVFWENPMILEGRESERKLISR